MKYLFVEPTEADLMDMIEYDMDEHGKIKIEKKKESKKDKRN